MKELIALAKARRAATDGEREARSIVSQSHAWEQILVYQCALEAFPLDEEFDGSTVGGVLTELR